MFSVGDKVIHPIHGAGTIVSIDPKRISSEQRDYYVIELLTGQGVLMVPVERAAKIGLRYPVKKADTVIQVLTSKPVTLPKNHRERQDEIAKRIRSGDTVQISEVVRNLAWRDREKKLTTADARLFHKAQDFLVGELAMCQGVEIEMALQQIEAALESVLPKV